MKNENEKKDEKIIETKGDKIIEKEENDDNISSYS